MIKTLACLVVCWLVSAGPLLANNPDPQIQTMQPGVRLSLVAEHPQLTTPIGIGVDDEGRVWLIASHTHFPPNDYSGPKHDEILVFGRNGQRHVFYANTHHTMDLELGPDGWVYLAQRDRILRVKDTNGDGKGDREENVVVLDSEAHYPHNGLSGLAWHPNGDLIFGIGDNFARPWTLTGRDNYRIHGTGEGGIFRCRPDGSRLRRIARGLWNPFGICVRDDGEIFAVDNDPGERPPCRLLHIVAGGDYGFQRHYGPEAHHPFVCWNGELRGTLPMICPTGEAPCGITPLGRGVIVPSWGDHSIDFFPLNQNGASYTSKRVSLVRGGRHFRPACIAPAPGQSDDEWKIWYLTDWVDGRYQIHGFGRLWKLEINMKRAAWVGPLEVEPPINVARQAAALRSGQCRVSPDELLTLINTPDPFLSLAVLQAMARHVHDWKPDDLKKQSAPIRAQAVLALKIAVNTSSLYASDESPVSRPSSSPRRRVLVDEWMGQLLHDEDVEVQFEALRWIADAQLKEYLPEVVRILKRSDLEYRLFEAAVATWNTLSGHPEAGIRNTEMLLDRVRDPASSPRLRAYALRLLPLRPLAASSNGDAPAFEYPQELTVTLLEELLTLNDPLLALEVVRTLAGNPANGQSLLAELAANPRQPSGLRAEAIAGLAVMSQNHLDLLIELADNADQSVRDEALRALRGATLGESHLRQIRDLASTHPDSADLVRAVIEPETLIRGRPALTDTAGWMKRLQAVPEPVDLDSGGRVFHYSQATSCSRCHRHNGRGNVVGPDLSAVHARRDRMWLLESLLQPSREMAPEYRPTMILLNDGRTFTGIRLRSTTTETLRDSNGQNQVFNRQDIELIQELDQSFMPDGLVYHLTDRELRDLIAFLFPKNI